MLAIWTLKADDLYLEGKSIEDGTNKGGGRYRF